MIEEVTLLHQEEEVHRIQAVLVIQGEAALPPAEELALVISRKLVKD